MKPSRSPNPIRGTKMTTEYGRCLTAPALMLRTEPICVVSALRVSIRIAGAV
jgi:hypothetical protein